jgi:glutamine amidotransferase
VSATRPRIVIVDYEMGNRRSVEKALEHVGARTSITREASALRAADAIVLPGVGAFPRGMRNLRAFELDRVLPECVSLGIPLLGICLGMQLLFNGSAELGERTTGLRLIDGEVRALRTEGRRVPHIGWNEVRFERESALTAGLPDTGTSFYHVHSYAAHPTDPHDVVGTTEYGERFAAIVERGLVLGTQFHPEKSSRDGLALLAAFLRIVRGVRSEAGRA